MLIVKVIPTLPTALCSTVGTLCYCTLNNLSKVALGLNAGALLRNNFVVLL